jgi:GH18 family chitinase
VFNDPPTQRRFSDMASSESNRQTFIASLVVYMRKYALSGVDIGKITPISISHLSNTEVPNKRRLGVSGSRRPRGHI